MVWEVPALLFLLHVAHIVALESHIYLNLGGRGQEVGGARNAFGSGSTAVKGKPTSD